MKNLVVFVLVLCFNGVVYGNACDCDQRQWTKIIGNIGYYDFAADVEAQKGIQDCNGSAGGYEIVSYNVGNGFLPVVGLYSAIFGNWNNWAPTNPANNFNLETFTEFFNSSSAGGSLGNHYQSVTLEFRAIIDPPYNILCGTQTGSGITHVYTALVTIYVGGDIYPQIGNTICSSRDYSFSELIGKYSTTNIYFNEVIGNNNGESFTGNVINFSLPASSSFELYWKGTVTNVGVDVVRKWVKNVYNSGSISFNPAGFPAQFTDVDNAYNLVTFSNHTTGPGYGYEANLSNGVYINSGNYYFSPVISGAGVQNIKLRSTHNGCFSQWIDTNIYVYPIVTNFVSPIINLANTFGSGEVGLFAKVDYPTIVTGTFPNTQILYGMTQNLGRFHFACEGTDYTFQVTNPQANVFYDWFSLRNGVLDTLGSGVSITLTTVDNPDLNESQSLLSNPFSNLGNSNSDIPFYVQGNGGVTMYVGDLTTVLVRPRNIAGGLGNFRKVFLGVVDNPEINPFNAVCYDSAAQVDLVVNSTNPTYLSYLSIPDIRTGRWNVDLDNFWEIIGDTMPFVTGNLSKYNYYKGQAVDTTKMYMWNGSTWNISVEPAADIQCYSNIENIPVVIKPIVNSTFNITGDVAVGTPVLGIASGTFFDPSMDSINWYWSDDLNVWNNDTCWHYLNDLGSVSVLVQAIDSFGCVGSTQYVGLWTLNGYLSSYDEVQDENYSVFPNPNNGEFNVRADIGDVLIVFDMNGKEVLNKIYDGGPIDLTPLKGEFYIINTEKRIYEKIVII